MNRRNRDNDQAVSEILPGLVQSKGWQQKLDLYSIFPRWEELLGEDIAACSRPWKIEREVLWIEVENSAWMQELQYEKPAILDRLNRALKMSRLKDIRMVLPKPDEGRFRAREEEPPNVYFERPSPEKIASFQEKVKSITDEKCREALFRFWYLSNGCKQQPGER